MASLGPELQRAVGELRISFGSKVRITFGLSLTYGVEVSLIVKVSNRDEGLNSALGIRVML